MALELLAGPIPVRHEGVEDRDSYLLYRGQWLEGVGLACPKIFYYDTEDRLKDGHTCVVQLDGRACIRNDNPSSVLGNGYKLDLLGGEVIITDPWSSQHRRVSKVTLSHVEKVADLYGTTEYAFLPDRALYTVGSTVRSRSIDNLGISPNDDPTVEVEATLPDYESSVVATFSRGSQGTVYIAYRSGQLYHYDYERREVIGFRMGLGMACEQCHFIPELGIFVSTHRESDPTRDSLRLWANEVAPAGLSDPVALTPLTKGQVSEVEVALTGSLNEPVSDFLIDWTLTGDGDLTQIQSRTNAEGKARVGYRAPLDSTPTVTIAAEAVF